ncbi:MAG TPA: LysR family transcriptional regulator [Pseudogracilibacillus sp.]|nr:LysR family transcriptional regulator [Pseudogracilibacillus sp.]
MNLEQLTYIVEVAETESLSVASENIHVTQSAISQSITNLEKKLGIKIFQRSRSGTIPTEAGGKVIQKAIEILGKMEELQIEANADWFGENEKLRLGTIPSPLMYLPKTLASFKKDYPSIQMEIAERSSQTIIDDIAEDKLDIGLVGLSQGGREFKYEDIDIQVVLRGQMIVAASKQSPLASRSSMTASQIQKFSLVIYDDDRLWEFIDELAAQSGKIDVLFSTNNLDAIRNAVKENLAITIAPDYTIKNDIAVESSQIVPVEIAGLQQDYPGMALVWSKSRSTRTIRNFIARLKTDMLKLQTNQL